MGSSLFKLGSTDVVRGLATAVIAGLILGVGTVVHGMITAPGFDVLSVDWTALWHNLVNAALIGAEGGFVGYIGKNFLSDENGAVLGRFGGTKP